MNPDRGKVVRDRCCGPLTQLEWQNETAMVQQAWNAIYDAVATEATAELRAELTAALCYATMDGDTEIGNFRGTGDLLVQQLRDREKHAEEAEAECDALREVLQSVQKDGVLVEGDPPTIRLPYATWKAAAAALAKHSGPIPEAEDSGIPKDLRPGETMLEYVYRKDTEHSGGQTP